MTGYSERIIGILEPKVGAALAQSALRIKCKKLGIDPVNIPADKIGLLADDLFEPLRIFAGEEFARALITQIKGITVLPVSEWYISDNEGASAPSRLA